MKFRFIAEDDEGYLVYTDPLNPGDYADNDDQFYIEPHNISIIYREGNDTTASPTLAAVFVLQGYDTDLDTYYLNDSLMLAFNVTTNGQHSSYKTDGTNSSNSSGHVI